MYYRYKIGLFYLKTIAENLADKVINIVFMWNAYMLQMSIVAQDDDH